MNTVTDSMSRARDCAEGGTMADGTDDTEKIIATETCLRRQKNTVPSWILFELLTQVYTE